VQRESAFQEFESQYDNEDTSFMLQMRILLLSHQVAHKIQPLSPSSKISDPLGASLLCP
jgi:hypothetical protein